MVGMSRKSVVAGTTWTSFAPADPCLRACSTSCALRERARRGARPLGCRRLSVTVTTRSPSDSGALGDRVDAPSGSAIEASRALSARGSHDGGARRGCSRRGGSRRPRRHEHPDLPVGEVEARLVERSLDRPLTTRSSSACTSPSSQPSMRTTWTPRVLVERDAQRQRRASWAPGAELAMGPTA